MHSYSLAANNLKISVLLKDWINGERRVYRRITLPTTYENDIDQILQDLSNDDIDAFEEPDN